MFSTFIILILWTRSPSQPEPQFSFGGVRLGKLSILFNIIYISGEVGAVAHVFWHQINFLSTISHLLHEIKKKLKINPNTIQLNWSSFLFYLIMDDLESRLRNQTAWTQILALSLASCVTLVKLLCLSVSHYRDPHIGNMWIIILLLSYNCYKEWMSSYRKNRTIYSTL